MGDRVYHAHWVQSDLRRMSRLHRFLSNEIAAGKAMGIATDLMIVEASDHLEGRDGRVAPDGGYLYIYLGDTLIHISSIPSPNLLADRSSDSVVENIDEFDDHDGNKFVVAISSSIAGIDWTMEQHPDDMEIIMNLHYDVRLNEH